MPEVKNTFLQSKMNKDLDSRLVPNGQYRDAQNININKSEGPDAGAIENIIGNLLITNFDISDSSCEVIGSYFDEVNERIFAFITNYNDTSIDALSNSSANFANDDPANTSSTGVNSFLVYYDFATGNNQILLFGSWLNFSKTHPILDINLLENLLFFTDNRNQPRKINVDKAISSPYDLTNTSTYNNPYYINEDQISVAKYYPYNPITLIAAEVVTGINQTVAGNQYTIGDILTAVTITGTGAGLTLKITSATGNAIIVNPGSGYNTGDIVEAPLALGQPTPAARYTITSGFEAGMQDVTSELLPQGYQATIAIGGTYNAGANIAISSSPAVPLRQPQYWVGATITLNTSTGAPTIPDGTRIVTATNTVITLNNNVTIVNGDIINIGANPNYDVNFQGDEDFLTDKFVKFAYRFKFDDNEYSLISPFTEECFVPDQDGYFIEEDYKRTFESTIVKFMENKIDRIKFRIQAPDKIDQTQMIWSEAVNLLKIDSIDIIYTDSDSAALYVIDTITTDQLLAKNQSTDTIYLYEYNSRKPIRTLPEAETVRVSDKVPIRARTQETVGNRVIYGNYVASLGRPEDLNYNVQIDEKYKDTSSTSLEIATTPYLRIEYPNHTVKQNRTYQIGVVLVDRYGRQSDVILSSNDAYSGAAGYQGSTYFHPYRTSNEALSTFTTGVRSDIWAGDSMKVLFNNVIPSSSSVSGYAGLYNSNQTNPLGWYSYKIVVKQQEQEYYNVYVPGILNGYPFKDQSAVPSKVDNVAHTVLFSDNINKVPRDLQEVGPEQKQFTSNVEFFTRVDGSDINSKSSQYYPSLSPDKVNVIGTYSDLKMNRTDPSAALGGVDWTGETYSLSPFYNIPGNGFTTSAVPFETTNNQLIARMSTRKETGLPGGSNSNGNFSPFNSPTRNVLWYNYPPLSVFETKPSFSNLDIYYETATSGRISNLNTSILTGDTTTPVSLQALNFNYDESMTPLAVVSSDFYPLASGGVVLSNSNTTCTLSSVTNGNGTPVSYFEVIKNANYSFTIRVKSGVYNWYKNISSNTDNFTLNFTVTNVDSNGVTVSSPITVNPPNLLSNAQPGWVDNGGSLNPVSTGSSPYNSFDTNYAPNAGTQADPVPSNLTQAVAGNTWLKLVGLNGFNGSAGTGIGGAPFMIKNELFWTVTKLEFYWTGKSGGAAWQDWTDIWSAQSGSLNISTTAYNQYPFVGAPSFSYTGDISNINNLVTMSYYTGQAYSNVSETVFHRLRALNTGAATLTGSTGSAINYVLPAFATSSSPGNPVAGWAAAGISDTRYRITLDVRDIGGNSGYLSRQLELDFFVTPNATASGNLQATSGGGSGGGYQGQSSGG